MGKIFNKNDDVCYDAAKTIKDICDKEGWNYALFIDDGETVNQWSKVETGSMLDVVYCEAGRVLAKLRFMSKRKR